MERQSVSSSNLLSVGFEAGILEIEFHDFAVYQYYDVPESIFDGLMNAESHGKYFDAKVKKAGFRYKRVH